MSWRARRDSNSRPTAFPRDDRDLDAGNETRAGEYSLGDKSYARLLHKLREENFAQVTPPLERHLLVFYDNGGQAAIKDDDRRKQVAEDLQELKKFAGRSAEVTAGVDSTDH